MCYLSGHYFPVPIARTSSFGARGEPSHSLRLALGTAAPQNRLQTRNTIPLRAAKQQDRDGCAVSAPGNTRAPAGTALKRDRRCQRPSSGSPFSFPGGTAACAGTRRRRPFDAAPRKLAEKRAAAPGHARPSVAPGRTGQRTPTWLRLLDTPLQAGAALCRRRPQLSHAAACLRASARGNFKLPRPFTPKRHRQRPRPLAGGSGGRRDRGRWHRLGRGGPGVGCGSQPLPAAVRGDREGKLPAFQKDGPASSGAGCQPEILQRKRMLKNLRLSAVIKAIHQAHSCRTRHGSAGEEVQLLSTRNSLNNSFT